MLGVLKGLLKISPYFLSAFLPIKFSKEDWDKFFEVGSKISDQSVETLDKITESVTNFSYSQGLIEIGNAMKKIRNDKSSGNFRIVIFIDDLDRCSPKKALEVFESIKVLLDIEGFILCERHLFISRLALSNRVLKEKGRD